MVINRDTVIAGVLYVAVCTALARFSIWLAERSTRNDSPTERQS